MRWGIGLLSLLFVVGLTLYVFVWNAEKVVPTPGGTNAGSIAQQQAQQIAGRGPDGLPASKSVTLEGHARNGQTDYLLVTDVVAGGAVDKYLGLKKGDRITKIGDISVRDYPGGDELAIPAVFEAAQRSQPLVIERDGKTTTLTPTNPLGGSGSGRPAIEKIPMH